MERGREEAEEIQPSGGRSAIRSSSQGPLLTLSWSMVGT